VGLLLARPSRFLLSLLLGTVISTPFVLVIFRPEINHQITQIQNQAAARYFQQLPGSSLSRINSLLRSSQAQQVSQAKPAGKELATAEQQLARDTAEQNRETAAFLSSNKGDTGLLIRLQALTAAASGSGTLKAAQVLLFLLLVAIDCMPVLVKLLQNLGREGVYDAKLREWQDTEIAAAQAAAASAQNRLNGLSAALPEVTENVKTARREVEDAWLRAWKTEQLRRIANGQNISPPLPASARRRPPPAGRTGTCHVSSTAGVEAGLADGSTLPPAWAPRRRRQAYPRWSCRGWSCGRMTRPRTRTGISRHEHGGDAGPGRRGLLPAGTAGRHRNSRGGLPGRLPDRLGGGAGGTPSRPRRPTRRSGRRTRPASGRP